MSHSAELAQEFIDLEAREYIEESVRRREAVLSSSGALCVRTGRRTGRSASDRFIVREPSIEDTVDWNTINRPFDAQRFEDLWERVEVYLGNRDHFLSHLHVGAHDDHYLPLEVRTELAWHGLFACSLFIATDSWNPDRKPEWRVLNAAGFSCDPDRDGTASDATVIINFAQRRILLAGMRYAGELKAAVFAVQNLLLPEKDVLPLHCSANRGDAGDTALFFGSSGSGKTTLSNDPQRPLIGDDEHGWTRGAVFNLEGGCYIRTRRLRREHNPIALDALRFGAIMENVPMDSSGQVDFGDDHEGSSDIGRCCFPMEHVQGRVEAPCSAEPSHLFFLCCDSTGVLPPVSILDRDAAAFHFLAGYGASKRATVARRSGPSQTAFSACFGARYLPRRPRDYAELLSRRIEEAGSTVYLINTGYVGADATAGSADGRRIPVSTTRRLINAALDGTLLSAPRERIAQLNLSFPRTVPGVDEAFLDPRRAWPVAQTYTTAAQNLARQLHEAVARFDPPSTITLAGPPQSAES